MRYIIIPILLFILLTTSVYAQNSWGDLINQTQDLYNQGQYQQAISTAKDSFSVAISGHGVADIKAVVSANFLGLLYATIGNHRDAEIVYNMALHIAKNLDPSDMAFILEYTETVIIHKEEYLATQTMYEQLIEITKDTLGQNHPQLVIFLINLGEIHKQQRNYSQAETYYIQALEIAEMQLHSHAIAPYLYKLGLVKVELGKKQEARQLLERSLDMEKEPDQIKKIEIILTDISGNGYGTWLIILGVLLIVIYGYRTRKR